MQTVQIILFSDDRESVLNATSEIRSLCETKGIEYGGPHTAPPIDLGGKDANISDEGVRLFGETPTDQEINQLEQKLVFSTSYQLHRYASDSVTKTIVKQDYPDNLFLRLKVEQSEFIGADKGNVPFSYDPNIEYNSEI